MNKKDSLEKQKKMLNKKIRKEMQKEKIKNDALDLDKIDKKEARKYILKYFLMEWKMIICTQVILFI